MAIRYQEQNPTDSQTESATVANLPPRVEQIPINRITAGENHRSINPNAMARIKESVRAIGLRTPVTVLRKNGIDKLVTGYHRVDVAKALGWQTIPAFVITGSELDAQMWEIAENLHRAELTALERDEQIAKWLELSAAKVLSRNEDSGTVPRDKEGNVQPADIEGGTVSQLATRSGDGKFQEGGTRAAARELGIQKDDAQRATKVASLTDEAKQTAVDVGLDDNRSALLNAAKQPAEAQAEHLRQTATKKAERKPTAPTNDIAAKIMKQRQSRAVDLIINGLGSREEELLSLLREGDWNGAAVFGELKRVLEKRAI